MDAGGDGVVQLTRNDVHDEGPSWSPDGTRITFTRGLGRRVGSRTRLLGAGSTVVRLRFGSRAAKRLRGARKVRLQLALASPQGASALALTLRR